MKEENNKWETLRAGYEEVQMVESSIENAYPEAYRLARKFHELYEQQAPFFGYITNPNSREFYPNSNNARLMAYVCYEIVSEEVEKARKDTRAHYYELVRNETRKEVLEEVLKVVNDESAIDGQYLEPSQTRKEERNRITERIKEINLP